MSRTKTEIPVIDKEDPIYYAELLAAVHRSENRRSTFNQEFCPEIPIYDSLAWRLQSLLDVVANISLCQPGNVSAVMASLTENNATLETQLFIIFNLQDASAHHCAQHLYKIFLMLHDVPYMYPGNDHSPKDIANEFMENIIKISLVIHDYSFSIFARHVTKHRDKFSDIQKRIVEQGQDQFNSKEHRTLLDFLHHVDVIFKIVAKVQVEGKLSTNMITIILQIYSYWTENNIIPQDDHIKPINTLLDRVDEWLADEHGIKFQLQRWGLKIMSFVISTNRLFALTQSRRLRNLLDGDFSVVVLPSPTPAPYRCDLSPETIKVAMVAALAGTEYLSAEWDGACNSFMQGILKKLKTFEVVHKAPTVHAELAMIMEMNKGKIGSVLPYIGVSKLSCLLCSHYIKIYNDVMGQNIGTRGCHWKAYPGWVWPELPYLDEALRAPFLTAIRQQLCRDLEQHETMRQLSDSIAGSGYSGLKLNLADILEKVHIEGL